MPYLLALVLIATSLGASEPWQNVGSPQITSAAEATSLVALAYRSTAAGMANKLFDWTAKTCARVGDEVVIRSDDDTYHLTTAGVLETWPISAEEVVTPASADDLQRASLALAAANCSNLPLNSQMVTLRAATSGGWDIYWRTEKNRGSGIHVGAALATGVQEFRWGRGSSRTHSCFCGQKELPPVGSG